MQRRPLTPPQNRPLPFGGHGLRPHWLLPPRRHTGSILYWPPPVAAIPASMRNKPFQFDVSQYPALPRVRGVFVAGTDTGVGKTLIAGAIARSLRKKGLAVEVFKPAATGCRRTREGLVGGDAEFLAACADSRLPLAEINPIRYRTALAPNVAAERERTPVDLNAIFDAYTRVAASADAMVVEGVGGLLCPISDDFWVIHLAKLTRLPLVIVTRAGLGAINHTLLTLHAARSAGITVAGVVINRYQLENWKTAPADARLSPSQAAAIKDDDLAMYTNPAQIAERGGVDVLAIVPDEEGNSVDRLTIGPDSQFAIDQAGWDRIIDRGM